MATKNLARTVIEGGRHGYNKWDRRESHKETRAQLKAYLSEVQEDPENWYDYDIEPTRPVYKGFTDKLAPMSRWLAAQCGRPWNDVRSDVAKKFDTRTTAGRHIVYDHLLRDVEVTPDLRYGRYYYGPEDYTTSYRRYEFYVDGDGYLREKTVVKRPGYREVPRFDTAQIANWLAGRCIGKVGNKYFWFVPTGKAQKHKGMGGKQVWTTTWGGKKAWYHNYYLRFYYLQRDPVYKYENGALFYNREGKTVILEYKERWVDSRPTFRQDRKLNTKELAFWNTIPEYYQAQVLAWAPTQEVPAKEHPYYKGRPYGWY
jgi:hypothetical protein